MLHFKIYSAIFPIIIKNDKVLMHKRKNTGYMDGKWDLAGTGHIEQNGTAKEALIRECFEELGIKVKKEDIYFAHLVHRVGARDGFDYNYIYFFVKDYEGEPTIVEKNKNSELAWFDYNKLPEDTIEDRKIAILNAVSKIMYDEFVV